MAMNIGGAETHILELCRELNRIGHDVTLASFGGVYADELVALDDAERGLAAVGDGIDLVAGLVGVEVDLAILIEIVHGNGIGIVLVTVDGQNAGVVTVQDLDGLIHGELLVETLHFSEQFAHNGPSLSL